MMQDKEEHMSSMAAAPLPHEAIFDILSRTPLKSVCRFRCVSKGWRDLIAGPIFLLAHRFRHPEPLLVDTGSFQKEEPDGGRDMRLMDMEGNVVRVIKGAGGYGMPCNTSLDGLICVNGASCGGVNVVDPATGKVLLVCPQVDVREHHAYPYVYTPYYTIFGFGRAAPSGDYKLVRLVAHNNTCEVLTLGEDGTRWRLAQKPPIIVPHQLGSPVAIQGVLYFLVDKYSNHTSLSFDTLLDSLLDSLLCFDLEYEQWKAGMVDCPPEDIGDDETWSVMTMPLRITELNGALCVVQPQFLEDNPTSSLLPPTYKCITNIWILKDSDHNMWIKAYTIRMAPSAYRYMPLRVTQDDKLLLQCSLDKGRSLVLQTYDPQTETFADVIKAPRDLAGRIGLCNMHLDRFVSTENQPSVLSDFVDIVLFFSQQ